MALAFATASPVSVARGASLQLLPALPHRIRYLALRPSIFAWVTKEPSSNSGSALSAVRMYFTLKKVTNNHGWLLRSVLSLIQIFLHHKIPSMTVEDIPGFSYRQE